MSIRVRLTASAVVALLAPTLHAQDAKKPPPTEFSGDVGAVAVSGNTSVSTYNANERLIRRVARWEFRQDFGMVYGRTAGIESSNLWRAGLRGDYAFRPRVAMYALTAFDRNRFAGIESRFAEGLGVVIKVLATDIDQLGLEGGYQLTQQRNIVGPDDTFSSLRAATLWKHAFTKDAYFFQSVEALPNLEERKDLRVNTETALVAPLSSHVGMKFSYVVRYDNLPALNAAGTAPLEKSDRIFAAGIQVTY